MADLLRKLHDSHSDWPFASRLRRATHAALSAPHRQASAAAGQTPVIQPEAEDHSVGRMGRAVVEPLSDRERDVLRLLCSDLDGPAIARELSVSLSTVRTHTQHIYAKLGVTSRRAAVRRAHQLSLLSHASQR
jgi:LuxR family maltose regulon positive regulatory protein